MLTTILIFFFVGIVSIQLIYYGLIFSKFAFAKVSYPKAKSISVSVLVCARNEAENLKEFIPKIIAQDYPDFEIVLINDASLDDTLMVMKSFEAEHDNVKIVDVAANDTFLSTKKYALTLGIKAATHDFLLFTDADCEPVSDKWVKSMSSHFTNKKSIVLGYGSYKTIKGNFLNTLIRFETVLTALQYFSFAKIGMPYMAVGRNLAYRKDEFFNVNGFTNHMNVVSGDDDLFINQIATNENTAISFSKGSFTRSNPKTNLKDWLKQKKRHVRTSKFYKTNHKFILALFYSSQLLFWVLLIGALVIKQNYILVGSLALVRFILVYIIYSYSVKKLSEKGLLLLLPVLELFLISMQLIIFISNLTTKPDRWS